MASTVDLDFASEIDFNGPGHTSSADRFISAPRESAIPLNVTPRTNRIARNFGLADERMLKFSDNARRSASGNDLTLQRTHVQPLFAAASKASSLSASAHLGARKQFLLALDGPGIPSDPFAFPLSWSKRNAIAVACGRDVYYQDLNTRDITHLSTLAKRSYGRLTSIEWSRDSPGLLAVGTSLGSVQLLDADSKKLMREWRCTDWGVVGGMNWNEDLLAVGVSDGTVELFDARESKVVGKLSMHKNKVHGVQWSLDGNYLATSDHDGIVQIWDARTSRILSNTDRKSGKMRHGTAPVKALAWCPWKSDLLATGSTYPDGKIRVWSVNSSLASPPVHTISVNTSITSVVWSPHCKEILSTHGTSWQQLAPTAEPPPGVTVLPTGAIPVKTTFTNSVTVHAYPSLKRVVSIPAHSAAVGHSCLSPDGTMVFTVCPAEEAMKMWKVWGMPQNRVRRESAFDKCTIR
ncbi:WD40 repeat-like protein [Wolfiporia cocos MD-104 SS10]|uniref:WD40 repeat-like protein n=1 Tax=Wolfiporia cocos (strain MD-104) TaxID=742152 RepID=A0A2H3JZ29_WOLCO|nr:WD40 repeat-like protein [Wolfiporia cocos MD-104 SS10]